MTGIEHEQLHQQLAAEEDDEEEKSLRVDLSFDSSSSYFEQLLLQTTESTEEEHDESTSATLEAEWNPVEFDLKKSSNPQWRNKKRNKQRNKQPPKRIQDIRLCRLDSGGSSESEPEQQQDKHEETTTTTGRSSDDNDNNPSYFDDWLFAEGDPGSPCAMFGKNAVASTPAEGFEGEFSGGDPEWDNNGEKQRPRSRKAASSSREKSSSQQRSSREKSRRQAQQKQRQEEESDDDEHDVGSDADQSDGGGSYNSDYGGSQSGGSGEDEYSESERSATDSPTNCEEDNVMVTPAMGKAREMRKKPPTLKRNAHQVTTPSVVKALKGKQAFGSDDEGDNANVDFSEFDSDLDSGGSGHSRSSNKSGRSSKDNGRRSKRETRLEAANSSFRGASASKKKASSAFDRSTGSVDLKAARKANNSFRGQVDMNKSHNALENKRRAAQRLNASKGDLGMDRKAPARAKSLGNPSTGKSKLMAGLSKFAGPAGEAAASAAPKSYGSTLSALKALSGGTSGGGGGSDLAATIMQQVHRQSAGLAPMELKAKPKPKMSKTMSLNNKGIGIGGGLMDASDKDEKLKVRRARTSNDRAQASLSELQSSYHDNVSKMRKQKLADASERSARSAESTVSAESQDSANARPSNLDRRAKSFSKSRSGATLDESSNNDETGGRPRLKRGGSKRLSSKETSDSGGELEEGGSKHGGRRGMMQKTGSRRGLQKTGSRRKIQQAPEYDATPQKPSGTNVIALLKEQEPVTEREMQQKGNRQMFHALMYRTRMGIDMDRIQQKVNGEIESSESEGNDQYAGAGYDSESASEEE